MAASQRQQQKQATRRHIIETAMQQYARTGFTRTTTADIARAARLAHGTIFVHFATQEELVIAVIDEFGSRINQRLHELAGGKGGVEEILAAHLAGLQAYEDLYTWLVLEGRLLAPEVRNTFVGIQSVTSFHLSQAAEREIAAGSILPLPLHMIFNGWVALVHHYLTNSDLFSPGESVLQRHGQELLRYYMDLITPTRATNYEGRR